MDYISWLSVLVLFVCEKEEEEKEWDEEALEEESWCQ